MKEFLSRNGMKIVLVLLALSLLLKFVNLLAQEQPLSRFVLHLGIWAFWVSWLFNTGASELGHIQSRGSIRVWVLGQVVLLLGFAALSYVAQGTWAGL